MSGLPWTRAHNGLRLTVRLTPRGGRDALGGLRVDADGRPVLLARVAAPPIGGAANAALVKLVAKTLRVPKSAVTITAGESGRVKTLEITGDAGSLERALRQLA